MLFILMLSIHKKTSSLETYACIFSFPGGNDLTAYNLMCIYFNVLNGAYIVMHKMVIYFIRGDC